MGLLYCLLNNAPEYGQPFTFVRVDTGRKINLAFAFAKIHGPDLRIREERTDPAQPDYPSQLRPLPRDHD